MDLLKIFTREEPIAGLEISDTYLRLVLLESKKEKEGTRTRVRYAGEEPIAAGVMRGGVIKKQPEFLRGVENLVRKAPLKIRYLVISLPPDSVYSRVFTFPKTVQGEKLEESMKLTVGFQLPIKPEAVYLDWEKIEGKDQNEILLAALPKQVLDAFIDALSGIGLKPIAVEFHPLSVARAIETQPGETLLIKEIGRSSANISVVRDRTLRFVRTLPELFATASAVAEEVRKVKDFYEAEEGPVARVLDLHEGKIVAPFSEHPDIKSVPGKWLVSAGAAMRGLLPRSADTLVSLMPVGTEEAYEYQKATTFAEFISTMTIGLSVFFALVFVGAWVFMTTLQQRSLSQIESLSVAAPSGETGQLEGRARDANGVIRVAAAALTSIPRLSTVFEELQAKIPAGIVVNTFTLASPYDAMTFVGSARDRAQLNLFKKVLEESPLFSEVRLPLTNLELKENIPFSVTFRVRDPQAFFTYGP